MDSPNSRATSGAIGYSMTPITWFQYLVATAGGLACLLFVIFCFVCIWCILVGWSKGRE